jgi:hypothetical protein
MGQELDRTEWDGSLWTESTTRIDGRKHDMSQNFSMKNGGKRIVMGNFLRFCLWILGMREVDFGDID